MSTPKSNARAATGRRLTPHANFALKSTVDAQRLNQKQKQAKANLGGTPSTGTLRDFSMMMVDPLNAPLTGKPDSNNWPTNVSRIKDILDVTTTSAGAAIVGVTGHTSGTHKFTATMTPATANFTSWGGTSDSQWQAQLASDSRYYRTLAYVVEWTPTQSMSTASGRVYMGHYALTATTDLPGTGSATDFFDDNGISGMLNEPMCTVVRPMTEAGFITMTGNTFSQLPVTIFAVAGAVAAVGIIGQLTITRIVETIPQGATLSRQSAKHTRCDPADCCVASNITGPNTTFTAGRDSYSKIVSSGLRVAKTAARVFNAYKSGGLSELERLIN